MENLTALDILERNFTASNKDKVTLIASGLSKRHFIELDNCEGQERLISNALKHNEWLTLAESEAIDNVKFEKLFSTEINEKTLEDARKRLESTKNIDVFETPIKTPRDKSLPRNYLTETAEEIKEDMVELAEEYYQQALQKYKEGNFEKAIGTLARAFNLNSFSVQFYLLKAECYMQLCDFRSALLTMNKLLSVIAVWTENNPNNEEDPYTDLKQKLLDKIVFCHYSIGQAYFDSKMYIDALDAFNKANELKPDTLVYQVRSVSCLFAMNRLDDAISLLNTIMNDSEANKTNVNLFVLRARLYLKNNNQSQCYYDLRDALSLQPDHAEAISLLHRIEEDAEQLRNTCLVLSLNNRVPDALIKITGAITMNPVKAEYHLQRGILHKRSRDFNSAIDDFLLGLEKMNNDESLEPTLYANFHRQILLTYNDFAMHCFEKMFYDDAIVLLNRAIKEEKNEKGFYVNRGDCFYKKNEVQFAMLDYEQAYDLGPKDTSVSNRIAKLYYEMGVNAYDEKKYAEASHHFNSAIKYAPNMCKYYISRARTYFFLEEKYKAQMDICISVLLDPGNNEIPAIISRIFVDKNLEEVIQSRQMDEAKEYLDDMKIKAVFNLTEYKRNREMSSKRRSQIAKTDSQTYHHVMPPLNEVLREKFENFIIIEEKKMTNANAHMLEEMPDLNSHIPNLVPYEVELARHESKGRKRDPNDKEIHWRKFHHGLVG